MAELLGLACEEEPLQALLLHLSFKYNSIGLASADG